MDHEFSGKIYPKTEDGQETFKTVKHMKEDRHLRPLRMDDIYIVIPENRYGLYHFQMDLSSEFSFKEYAIEFGFYIEKSAAFGTNASMAITAFVLFFWSIWVTIGNVSDLRLNILNYEFTVFREFCQANIFKKGSNRKFGLG